MDKVYILTSNSPHGDEESTIGVFADQAIAEASAELFRGMEKHDRIYDVDEWTVLTEVPRRVYSCVVSVETGDILMTSDWGTTITGFHVDGYEYSPLHNRIAVHAVAGSAESPEAALTSALKHRTRILAEREVKA